MQKFQDTQTGIEWHFEDGADIAALPNAPATLSANIIPRPSPFHVWNAGAWVLDTVAQSKANNENLLAQIAALEAKQVRPVRELLIDPTSSFARQKVAAIDAEIALLRGQIK